MRIAIYARYSSDLQNPLSVDDQVGLCKRVILQQFGSFEPIAVYSDAAISGATMRRPGLRALLQAAEERQYTHVVAEGLDRISRSLSDIASIYELLTHLGVKIHTQHEGAVSDLHVGFKGTMNALYLRDLRDKVKRAHTAIVSSGRAASSVAYGYRAVRGVVDERGHYINGLREIMPEEARIVQRIFEEAAQGISKRAICRSLDEDGVPSPTGGTWKPHTLGGERSRYKGILYNDLYRGVLVYNRTRKSVDPRTGRRKYVVNPESEWIVTQVPELRIISDELWHRSKVIDRTELSSAERRSTARPLTGLMKCGRCGGKKSIANNTRYICSTYRERDKRCRNTRGTREAAAWTELYAVLRQHILNVDDWQAQIAPDLDRKLGHGTEHHSEAKKLGERIERLLGAVEAGVRVDLARLRSLQEKHDRILAAPAIPIRSSSSEEIRRDLLDALEEINDKFDSIKFSKPIRRLLSMIVSSIVCTPIEGRAKGETMQVNLRPDREWTDFYIHIHSHWPSLTVPASQDEPTVEDMTHRMIG